MSTWTGAVSTDWNNALNWTSGGIGIGIPNAGVDAIFSGAVPNPCVLGVNRVCRALTFIGYTSTVDLATFTLTANNNITFQANQSSRIIGTTGRLLIAANSTITSNSGTWPLSFGHGAVATITLADDMRVSLDLTSSVNAGTYNLFKLYIGRDILSSGSYLGTTDIIMNGSGTCTLPSTIGLEVDTAGTITITGSTGVNRRFVVTNAGSITMTGVNLTTGQTSATTINVGGRTIGNLTAPTTTSTTTISTNVYVTNFFGGSSHTINGPGKIFINGNYNGMSGGGNIAFECVGSGNITSFIQSGGLTVNTSGSYTTSGTVTLTSSAVFLVLGTSNITLTTATFSFTGGCTINVNGRTFGSVSFGSSVGTTTVATDMYCTSFAGGNSHVINGPGRIYVNGPYAGHNGGGNVTIELIGSGSFANNITNNLVINTTGTYTFTSNINSYSSITHTQGTINPQTFLFQNNVTTLTFNINAPGFNLYDWTLPNIGAIQIMTINSTNGNVINILRTLTFINNNPTFAGNSGWTTANFNTAGIGFACTLQSGVTYTVRLQMNFTGGTFANRPIIKASLTNSTKAILTLKEGATQSMIYINAIDIDSSGGQTIWSFGALPIANLLRTINWNPGVPLRTVAYTFVN